MSISGRPLPGEFADYAQADIDRVVGEDIVSILAAQSSATELLLGDIPDEFAGRYAYAQDKWTLKQIVGHLVDDERIFLYRALCLARREPRPLPGFDENHYVDQAHFEERSFVDLLEELRVARNATVTFFKGLSPQAWLHRGDVNGYTASVRGLAFHLAAHELHHLSVIRQRYLTGLPRH